LVTVTVYSLPGKCTACFSTELALKSVPFEKVVMDSAMIDKYRGEGMAAAPVVVVDMGDGSTWTWNGYRHDDIKRLKSLFRESLAA
jgi:hypothetical protein